MFRIVQADQYTGALHINFGALSAHKDAALIDKILTGAMSGNSAEIARVLSNTADKAYVSRVLPIFINYVHELRHTLDLLFTPAAMDKIRSAFEFTNALFPFIAIEESTTLTIPIASAFDPVNRELLGLQGYENSPEFKFSQLAANRLKRQRYDNETHNLENGWKASFGADAILEALAVETQCGILNALFADDQYKKLLPFFYDRKIEWTPVDQKYMWYQTIVKMLGETHSAGKLFMCIAFASLCGSIAKRANYEVIKVGEHPNLTPGRFVGEKLTRNRFEQLLIKFRGAKLPGESFIEIWAAVDAACLELFGSTVANEIDDDIASDEELISKRVALHPPGMNTFFSEMGGGAFEDIVRTRRRLLTIFREHPTWFISPAEFLFNLTPLFKPVTVLYYPQGMRATDFPEERREFCCKDRVIPLKNNKEDHLFYAFISEHCVSGAESVVQIESLDSWKMLIGLISPFYKLLLNGNKFRSMLEVDIVAADAFFSNFPKLKMVWDDFFRHSKDISNSEPLFEFYGLETHNCDVCGKRTKASSSKFVSGLTIRQNNQFVDHYMKSMFRRFLAYKLLVVDWSGWLLCSKCLERWEFVDVRDEKTRKGGLLQWILRR